MKKILNRLLSRMVITCFLVVVQLAIMILGVVFLQDRYIYISGALKLLSVIVVMYLITKDTNPMVKMAWMVPILIFPVLGGLMYVLYGHVLIPKKLRKNFLRVLQQEVYENVKGDNWVPAENLKSEPTYRICNYMENVAEAPLYKHTSVKYYAIGDDVMDDLIRDLESAEKYIFMEYFIVDKGYMWDTILEILKRKAAEGLDVRFMYDDIGSVFNVPKYYWKELESYGIKCMAFNQVVPFFATIFNNRDHRKITVIDGKIAHTGGYNMADEYINKIERFGHWKDTALMLEGPAVDTFLVLFLQMWTYSNETLDVTPYMVEHKAFDTPGFVVPYGDIPLDKDKVGENVYIDILNHARDFVHIMTPYLILDGELLHALKFAAERGVDVSIIMPGIPDKKSAYYLAKTYYPTLLASGVKIYEYTPGFIHAKIFVSDNSRAVVGTINLDYRSLYHHFECATYLYRTSSVLAIEEDFQATKDQCHRVSTTDVEKLPFHQKALGLLTKLVAPLM